MKRILTIFSLISLVASCTPENKNNDDAALALLAVAATNPQRVTLDFEAVANGQALTTGSNITVDSRTVRFRDFRFYVSEVKLVRADGSLADVVLDTDGVWQANGVALIDVETTATAETNFKVVGSAPAGGYTAIQYTIGVPEALNHLNRTEQPAPLNIGLMYWAWQSGYKHSKIEFSFDNGTNWTNLHVGSTNGCQALPNPGNCTEKFRASIRLTGDLKLSNQKISLNVDEFIKGHTPGGGATCMPKQAGATCTPLLRAFGLNEANGAADSNISQRIFSLK
ncbi:MAG: metallo-mystery pair system four-Cys motif protein [Leptospira sp.]|nr:metallo-mystery pair system four-Cys motif protein [Leptospira sp.]